LYSTAFEIFNIMIENKARLGEGVFTLSEVSHILNLPKQKVYYWVKEFWDTRFSKIRGKKYSWGKDNKAINFFTLIEFYVYYQLRDLGVSSKRIQTAHDVLAKQLNTDYPFANAKLLTDRKTIFFVDEVETIINADQSLQINLNNIIKPFCKKIEFDTNGLPTRFWPEGKNKSVVVDPGHQFGIPTIDGTNITVDTIYSLYKAGDSIDKIATIYELDKKRIKDAINYCKAA